MFERGVGMKICEYCEETLLWKDEIVQIESDFYHLRCVVTLPSKFEVYNKNNFETSLGSCDSEDIGFACEMLEDEEYLKEEEEC